MDLKEKMRSWYSLWLNMEAGTWVMGLGLGKGLFIFISSIYVSYNMNGFDKNTKRKDKVSHYKGKNKARNLD